MRSCWCYGALLTSRTRQPGQSYGRQALPLTVIDRGRSARTADLGSASWHPRPRRCRSLALKVGLDSIGDCGIAGDPAGRLLGSRHTLRYAVRSGWGSTRSSQEAGSQRLGWPRGVIGSQAHVVGVAGPECDGLPQFVGLGR